MQPLLMNTSSIEFGCQAQAGFEVHAYLLVVKKTVCKAHII